MEVYKFGGTSVGTVERIRTVARLIDTESQKIVVLSANAKTTDRLVEIIELMESGRTEEMASAIKALENFYLDLAGQLLIDSADLTRARFSIGEMGKGIVSCAGGKLDRGMRNWIITRGEVIRTIPFSLFLLSRGLSTAFMHAADIIRLDRQGQPDTEAISENLQKFLHAGNTRRIILTQGFICTDHEGNIETLGRGGSDLTASLLGAAAGASVIQIWSDVDGFLNNDPNYVRSAAPISHLSFDEAAELAYFGARVLHPSTLNPAREAGIPVLLKNTLRPEARGTIISNHRISGTLKAAAAKDNIWVITIHSNRMLMACGFLKNVFEVFERYRTSVDMVTTSEVSVSMTIDNPENLEAIAAELENLGQVTYSNGFSIICVVGDHLSENRGKVRQLFAVLEDIPIRMISYGAARNSISMLVETRARTETLESLNALLSESYQTRNPMHSHSEITTFRSIKTPFYHYDLALLRETLESLCEAAGRYDCHVHYALKANTNTPLLDLIRVHGLGADCVSGNEIRAALKHGFSPENIVFAGVGKTDEEILLALKKNIGCLNVESLHELQVIDDLAGRQRKIAPIALRINPDVEALTHAGITTGTKLNKFGIGLDELPEAIAMLGQLRNLKFKGLHFHIGSQITNFGVFEELGKRVNRIQDLFIERGFFPEVINLGGGLGIDYTDPDSRAVPDFEGYFRASTRLLKRRPGQRLYFELGRSIVGQCGNLVSKVLYLKRSGHLNFVIIDAGMNHMLRPALYGAYHKIQNLVSIGRESVYQVAGPVCESSDIFRRDVSLPETKRGDLLVIRSTAAYGAVMSSNYNLREPAKAIYSSDFGQAKIARVNYP